MTGPDYLEIDASDFDEAGPEAMGTKPKIWLTAPGGQRWLFKQVMDRVDGETRGEDWAERIASQIGTDLGIACASVELAHRRSALGILSRHVAAGSDLVHGNEVLANIIPTYPKTKFRGVAEYRIDTIAKILDRLEPAPPGRSAVVDFAGYLVFDALVGNTDRHHQNWGLLAQRTGERRPALCPSFDHASSLGCTLSDRQRSVRLTTRDAGQSVDRYASRARCPFADARTLTDAVVRIGRLRPGSLEVWRVKLAQIADDRLADAVHRVPTRRMSERSKEFAVALLQGNRRRLLATMTEMEEVP